MKIELASGAILELNKEDEMRVIKHFSSLIKEHEEHHEAKEEHAEEFLHRALSNICTHIGWKPSNEDQLKHAMTEHLYLGNASQTDLCYECIEAIIGMFAVQHYKDVE